MTAKNFSHSLVKSILSLAAAGLLLLGSHSAANPDSRNSYEPAVLEILETIKQGKLDDALRLADEHVSAYPKSRIGFLLKGDILRAMSSQLSGVGDETVLQSDTITELKHQIKNRWRHKHEDKEITHQRVPASLIDMGQHDYVMVTDMRAGQLYLYRNNRNTPELVRDYYLTVGSSGYGKEVEGDNKTPIGVYSIYQHIAPEELPDLYGAGAYPVNYPNRFDRSRKRTGYGIWLHGTPSDTYARAPWASEGCFVLSNDDLKDIENYIDVESRTPVILAETVNWVTVSELQTMRQRYQKTVESWRQDWESLNTDAYLKHYSSEEFNFGRDNYQQWAQRKRQVNSAKTFIQVDMDIKSLFLYPGESDMFVVQYRQRYLSNNYAGVTEKEQYWRRDKDGRWKIIFES